MPAARCFVPCSDLRYCGLAGGLVVDAGGVVVVVGALDAGGVAVVGAVDAGGVVEDGAPLGGGVPPVGGCMAPGAAPGWPIPGWAPGGIAPGWGLEPGGGGGGVSLWLTNSMSKISSDFGGITGGRPISP
jgi:hypothetical protein